MVVTASSTAIRHPAAAVVAATHRWFVDRASFQNRTVQSMVRLTIEIVPFVSAALSGPASTFSIKDAKPRCAEIRRQ